MVFRRGKTYYASYTDHDGRRRKVRSGPDHAVAVAHETKLKREVQLRRAGLYNPVDDHRIRPIGDVVEEFLRYVERGDPGDDYIDTLAFRIYTAMDWLKIGCVGDLYIRPDGVPVDAFLDALVAGSVTGRSGLRVTGRGGQGGVSHRTRDEYGTALRYFGRWLEQEGLVPRNPITFTRKMVSGRDETFVRRAISMEEVHRLCEAAMRRDMGREGHDEGRRLACLYYMAATTGLRKKELAALQWEHINLEDRWIELPAQFTKNRRPAHLPINEKLVEMLRGLRGDPALACGFVFWVPSKAAVHIRKDAEAAGIPVMDEQGRTLDFHCLRTSCATNLLRAGVRPDLVQRIMRHSDIRTTMQHYSRQDQVEMTAAVDRL